MPYRDPEKQRAAVRECQRRRRAGGGGKAAHHTRKGKPLPSLESLRVKTASDILAALGEQLQALRDDGHLETLERARGVAVLASVMLRAVETADLAARIEALESRISEHGAGLRAV